MKKLSVFFAFIMTICAYAYAADIAFYVGEPNVDGWYTAAAMLADVETIKNGVGNMFEVVSEFGDDKLDEFADWAEARMDDGKLDIIWLNGCVPSSPLSFSKPGAG